MLQASAALWYLKWHGWLGSVSTAAQVLSPSRVLSARGSEEAGRGNIRSPFAVIYSLAACFDRAVFEPILKKLAAHREKTGCL